MPNYTEEYDNSDYRIGSPMFRLHAKAIGILLLVFVVTTVLGGL